MTDAPEPGRSRGRSMVAMSTIEETRTTPLVPLLTADDAPACADGPCSWSGPQAS